MRQAIGVAVLGGMLGVTLFGIVLTPVFFAVVDRVTRSRLGSTPGCRRRAALYAVDLKFVIPLAVAIKDAAKTARDRLRRGEKPIAPK